MGIRPIRLYVDPKSEDGSVLFTPTDKGATIVTVGVQCRWPEALSVLFHELYEAALIDLNLRYGPKPSYSEEASDFIFLMSHNQLSEAHERMGYCLAYVLPDFEKAYDKHGSYVRKAKR